jgi:plastocyanin
MPKLVAPPAVAVLTLVLANACGSSGEGGREVQITQSEDGCTPTRIEAATGEKLKFVMTNETGGIYELEGEEGTEFEEVVVPEGKSRSAGFTVPDEEGAYPLKCYVPDGVETIIEVQAATR